MAKYETHGADIVENRCILVRRCASYSEANRLTRQMNIDAENEAAQAARVEEAKRRHIEERLSNRVFVVTTYMDGVKGVYSTLEMAQLRVDELKPKYNCTIEWREIDE